MHFTMPPVGVYITEVVRVKKLLVMVFKTRALYQNRAKSKSLISLPSVGCISPYCITVFVRT